jgi:HAE1 family hydrophobic/amphiphilic exporter-1
MIFKTDLSIYAFVGLIMLIGIVKKNAIMMIDFALEAQRKEGKNAAEAIYDGSLTFSHRQTLSRYGGGFLR